MLLNSGNTVLIIYARVFRKKSREKTFSHKTHRRHKRLNCEGILKKSLGRKRFPTKHIAGTSGRAVVNDIIPQYKHS